jgi:hypothetical protein
MDQLSQQLNCWESQEQIVACRVACGVSPYQQERWAGLGLIPGAKQPPVPGMGSYVVYPPGTCAQIAAAARLHKVRSLTEYVGNMLWWEGYPVDDKYWALPLKQLAGRLDRVFAALGPLIRRYNRDSASETLGDRLARTQISDTIGTRIARRLPMEDLAQLFGTMADVAVGESVGIEIPSVPPPIKASDEESHRQRDADWMIRGLDLGAADRHSILGQKFTFRKALPETLASLSLAFSTGSFSEVMRDRSAIFAARDDLRNAFLIATDLRHALKDLYGDGAFGLRLMAWIADKQPELAIAVGVLGFARLRQIPNDLYSSAEIAEMAGMAARCREDAAAIRQLRSSRSYLEEVLAPKRIKAGLKDPVSYRRWLQELEAAKLRASV